MSTVVIVRKGNKAVIAADTMSGWGNTKVTSKYRKDRSKIIQAGESFIGTVGASAHNNVIASVVDKYGDQLSFQSTKHIFESYLRLHQILKEEYYLKTEENDDDPYESSQIDALIVNRHGIFGMYTWREVFEYERFWAIGTGSAFALGAMYSVYDRVKTAEEIAEIGVTASCEFDRGSGLPFTLQAVIMLRKKGGR